MAKQDSSRYPKNNSAYDIGIEKALPSNIEAERYILGAIILQNENINLALERLKPDDYFLAAHRKIYEKMQKLTLEDRGIDPLTLQEELRRAGELDMVGGAAYIASLFEGVPRFSKIDNYIQIVKDRSLLRKLIITSNHIMMLCFDDEEEARLIVDRAAKEILSLSEEGIKKGFEHVSDVAERQLEIIEKNAGRNQVITGLSTGFADLDYMTTGLQRGDMIVIAARPSMGKCLAADSEILLEDGSIATIEELFRKKDACLLTLGDDYKFSKTNPSAYIDDGIKPVYRVTTKLGRYIDSTLAHPYLTINGWKPLLEIQVGTRIAVPRIINVFGSEEIESGKIKVLAYLIGDGSLTNGSPSFTNTNPVLQKDFCDSINDFPGLKTSMRDDGKRAPSFRVSRDFDLVSIEREAFADRFNELLKENEDLKSLAANLKVSKSLVYQWLRGVCLPQPEIFDQLCKYLDVKRSSLAPLGMRGITREQRNDLTVWLENLGLYGCDSHAKFIPAFVFQLTKKQLALFLNRLFSTDGWVAINKGQAPQLGYASVSERLARQVQHLLLRFGVIGKIRGKEVKYKDSRRTSWQLDITHGNSIRTFVEEIGIFGKEEKIDIALEMLSVDQIRNNRDLVPVDIWDEIVIAKGSESWSSMAKRANLKGYSNIQVGKRALSRARLDSIATALGNEHLHQLAQSDVYWDEIVSIEYLGDKQVYDLTIPETHNFIANDICVHNTAFSLNIAQNAALKQQVFKEQGEKAIVAFFSLEMSNEQLVSRLLCSNAAIDAHRLRTGMLNKENWKALAVAVGELSEAKIFLDDTPGISTIEMRAKCRRLKHEQKGLDLVIVDYLQLMSGRGKNESRQQEVSQISRDLKILAKELNVPMIALSQLSRAPETRTGNHKPQLSDLRESGGIEQDSDVVMFIYRDEVYKPETEKPGIAEIIIGKQRNGPIGSVELVFIKEQTKFSDKAYGS